MVDIDLPLEHDKRQERDKSNQFDIAKLYNVLVMATNQNQETNNTYNERRK